MKILFITNIPSPSRVDFFEELGLLSKLTVIYEKNHVDYREDSWLNFSANNYCSVYLSKNIFKKFMVLKKYLQACFQYQGQKKKLLLILKILQKSFINMA